MTKPKACMIIAEAGVNHNGRLELALQLIDSAVEAGADVVKFQTFTAELLASPKAEKAAYQKKQTGDASQLAMLKDLELPRDAYRTLFQYAHDKSITCLSTAFDLESLDFLLSLGMGTIKIPSGEITNAPFLLAIGQKRLPMILSTGMATLDEIERALAILAFGFFQPNVTPRTFQECWDAWVAQYKQDSVFKKMLTVLHCTTNYPADFSEIHMRAMLTIQNQLGFPVGYSDHSLGDLVPIVAVSMGAVILEKHMTLDTTMAGPDHAASLDPAGFKALVHAIRAVERICGSAIKGPSEAEVLNKPIVRRGVYARMDIEPGTLLTSTHMVLLRPEKQGQSALDYWSMLNEPAKKHYAMYEEILG